MHICFDISIRTYFHVSLYISSKSGLVRYVICSHLVPKHCVLVMGELPKYLFKAIQYFHWNALGAVHILCQPDLSVCSPLVTNRQHLPDPLIEYLVWFRMIKGGTNFSFLLKGSPPIEKLQSYGHFPMLSLCSEKFY